MPVLSFPNAAIQSRLVAATRAADVPSSTATSVEPGPVYRCIGPRGCVLLRSPSGGVIARVPNGERVVVIKQRGGRASVRYRGTTGFMASSQLKADTGSGATSGTGALSSDNIWLQVPSLLAFLNASAQAAPPPTLSDVAFASRGAEAPPYQETPLSDVAFASRAAASNLGAAPYQAGAMTGYTAPGITYDKMRQMQNGSARPLDLDIKTNVVDPTFRAAWTAWYEQAWLPFYEKFAGDDPSTLSRIRASFTSDEVAARAEAYRQQLSDFYVSYPKQRNAAGQLVPPPTGASPALVGAPTAPGGLTLPWWVWGIGLAGVAGVGYLAYTQVRDLQNKKAGLEKFVLPKILGEDLAKAYSYKGEAKSGGVARDPGCGCHQKKR